MTPLALSWLTWQWFVGPLIVGLVYALTRRPGATVAATSRSSAGASRWAAPT